MATTATLNGGPTGGLHTTSTLIHSTPPQTSENPPQEETCRVDSNSSFESGHDDQTQGRSLVNEDGGNNVEGEDNNNHHGTNPNAYYFDTSSKKRRKQSRPVRIPLDLSEGDAKVATTAEGQSESEGAQHGLIGSHHHHHVPLNLSGRNNDASSSSSEDETSKPLSSFIPTTTNHPTFLGENDKTELAGQGTKDSPHRGVRSNTSSPSLPPSYSPGLFAPNPFGSLFSANLNLIQQQQNATTSNSTSTGGTTSTIQNLPPHRIFNPEAYCDLCNKEFCNKYFLKTHKANKHGVYSDMSPSLGQPMIGTGGGATSTSNTSFLTGSALLSGLATNSNTGSSNSPAPSGSGATNHSHHQQQQQSQSHGIMVASSSTNVSSSTCKTGSANISSEIPFSLAPFCLEKVAGSSNGSQSRESFCELCQKEFCNKYFLKRHKAKIHGIPMDMSSISAAGSGRSSSSSTGSQGKSSRPFPNGSKEGLPFGMESFGLEIVAKHLEESNQVIGVEGDMVGGKEEGELSSADDEQRDKSPAGGESDDNSSLNRTTLASNPNSNAVDNTCQFCLRDFSCKQHLINHLLKKHRLLIPSTFPPFLFPFPSLFEEQGDTSEGQGGVGVLFDNNGNSAGGEPEYECNICNRSFTTVYLLRMHKSYFHTDSHQGDNNVNEQDDTESEKGAYSLSKSKRRQDEEMSKSRDGAEEGSEHGSNNDISEGKVSLTADDNNATSRSRSKAREGKRSPTVEPSPEEVEGRGESTSDSDDLRRLQTMIMELNRVSSAAVAWSPPLGDPSLSHLNLPSLSTVSQTGTSSTMCPICNKEFYSAYFLQQHMQHYHSTTTVHPNSNTGESPFMSIKNEGPGSGTPESIRIKTENSPFTLESSSSSKKESIPTETLKERLLIPDITVSSSSQSGTTNSLPTPPFLTPCPKGSISNPNNNNTLNKDGLKRPSPSLSRSYCTICHKELCNKYFMRTHMLKMHGISIESSTGLGGVTCDICNKELCSKYFLKVHKQNTHGIVEDGPSTPNPPSSGTPKDNNNSNQSSTGSGGQNTASSSFPILATDSSLTGLNLSTNNNSASSSSLTTGGRGGGDEQTSGDVENRYFSHFPEVCPFVNCGTRFRSSKWLKSHLQQHHGDEGKERWKSIERSLRRSHKLSQSNSSSRTSGTCSSLSSSKGQSSASGSSGKLAREKDDNKCAFCSFSSGDVDTMKLHLIKEHSSQLASKQGPFSSSESSLLNETQPGILLDPLTMLFQKMEGTNTKLYRCSYCPFTTSILVYLYAHERTHTGLGVNLTNHGSSNEPSPAFQCPMCFHTFDQAETFQQHLIGHQMSGVLAPFFTPSHSGVGSGAGPGRLGFLTSPSGSASETSTPTPDPRSLLSLPLLNGSANDNLYWALKNATSSIPTYDQSNGERNKEEAQGTNLTAGVRKKRKIDMGSDPKPRKRQKTLYFRCSYCSSRFNAKELALIHVRKVHGESKKGGGTVAKGSKKGFRCRKCKFTSTSYDTMLVHNKLQHASSIRNLDVPRGRGVAREPGNFLMQSFLLTSSEEDDNPCNQFVTSVVHLPVREKVSKAIRVSFSLTPTTDTSRNEEKAESN